MNNREMIIKNCFNSWITKDISVFLRSFADDVLYVESWGPAYKGKKQIKSWFSEWNKVNRVLRWDIQTFFHIDTICICEWYFKCECVGIVDGFNGVSIITFNEADEIVLLKEFQSKTSNIYPYD